MFVNFTSVWLFIIAMQVFWVIYFFQTLGDTEKRAQYDNFGTTSGQAQQQHAQRRDFFGGGFDGFSFHFGGRQTTSSVQKYRMTLG